MPNEIEDDKFELKPELKEYRNQLCLAEQEAQESLDKTIITLSGGALGISFAFIKDIVPLLPLKQASHTNYLLLSWKAWGLSIICILVSYFFSNLAFRRAIKQVDDRTIYKETAGGNFSKVVAVLNFAGMATFLLGVIFIITFISKNIGGSIGKA